MYKTTITITIDKDIAELLKQENNYSSLINEQLKAFYAVKECENKQLLNQKLAEIKQILKKNRKKRREFEAQLAKITQKEKKIKQFLKQKNLTRAKLIKQIEQRRAAEQTSHRRVQYYDTAEEEADRILKGGGL